METKIKLKKKNKLREEGPTRNQTWGILKYLSVEIFTETLEIDQGRVMRVSETLDQKLGYDSYHIIVTIKTILYYLYYNVMQYINLMIIFLIQDFIVKVTDWYSIKLIFSRKSIKEIWTNEIYII